MRYNTFRLGGYQGLRDTVLGKVVVPAKAGYTDITPVEYEDGSAVFICTRNVRAALYSLEGKNLVRISDEYDNISIRLQ